MTTRTLRYALSLLALLVFSAHPATAKRLDGVFTRIVEANVVVLDYGDGTYDIRISGIETPAAGQPFAAEARQFVTERLLNRPGAMRFRYRNAEGQMVARVFYRADDDPSSPERDLGLDLVAAGLAWVRPGAKYRSEGEGKVDALTSALREAQEAQRGIWSEPDPVAPWTFRGQPLPAEATPIGSPLGTNGNIDINMSQDEGDDNECAIAKNPNNPLQLAAHCNSLAAPWRSTDGGQTWEIGGSIGSYCCDPNLAWDSFGNLYATFLSGSFATVTKLSTDGGATFADLASFGGSTDQPSVVATDLTGGNVALWIVWNQGGMVARGALVTGLGVANVGTFVPQQAAATGGSCSFGDLSVSPGGVVVQVCGPQTGETGGNVVINRDVDGLGPGVFGPAIHPTTTNVGGFDFIPAQDSRSIDSETGLVYDRNPASPHFGRLYLLYTQEVVQEGHDMEVMIRHSDDDGATWSDATRVNSDATDNSQFLPKIAADPATGNMAICWHDARNSAGNTAMEVYCDTTTPATYPAFVGNVPVSDGVSTSNGSGVEFGDYSGLTVGSGYAHPTWADTSNSTGDNPDGNSGFDAYTDSLPVLAADFTFGVTPPSQAICAPADAVYTVNVGAFGGFNDPVDLAVSGEPAGTTTGFSVDPVTPPNTSTLTIGNTGAATAGPSTITVTGTSSTGPKGVVVSLHVSTATPGALLLLAPVNTAIDVPLRPILDWTDATQAISYELEVATDAAFTSVVYSRNDVAGSTHTLETPLESETGYFWRVRGSNPCDDGAYSTAFSFTTRGIPPVLLVDDDDNSPNTQPVYVAELTALSPFDVWDVVAEGAEPTLSDLTPYDVVIWFSGDRFTGNSSPTAGPQSAAEAALGTFLDGGEGRCVFISSQDYFWDMGGATHDVPTAFMLNYLGVAPVGNSSDDGDYNSVTGLNLFSGLGPNPLTYGALSDFSDRLAAGPSGLNAWQGNNGFIGGVSKTLPEAAQGIFLGFPFETMQTAARNAALVRLFELCGNVIFIDGFESGDTDAWTNAVP